MNKTKQIILILCLVIFLFLLNPPIDFPVGAVIKIEQGESLHSVSLQLKNENIIRSRLAFEAFVILYGGEKHIKYYDYLFEKKLPVYKVAERVSKGEHRMPAVAVTIPEGFNVSQIADTFASKLINFNKNKFLLEAEAKEGYLFPDTYFFLTIDNEQDVLNSISENFEKKISLLRPLIASGSKIEKDIIIMASLIEGEAKGDADRGFIAGILWKRLSLGMPLQVDVAPLTYKTKGLPKSPIGNPGLLALKAAITPSQSAYLYYLHDKDGNIHYAKNFEEHNRNIQKYLK